MIPTDRVLRHRTEARNRTFLAQSRWRARSFRIADRAENQSSACVLQMSFGITPLFRAPRLARKGTPGPKGIQLKNP